VTVEVFRRSLVRIDLHAEFLGVFADVNRHAERLRDLGRFLDGVVHPALPCPATVDEDELGIMAPDTNHDGLGVVERIDELLRFPDRFGVLLALERPRPRHGRGA
jgi:hypothetical protein